MGNPERSAAALDALDKQQPLPDVGVVRTPRTATGLSHRLVLLLGAPPRLPAGTTGDPRRAADPRVDAWCGAVLGRPGRYRFVAEVRDAEGEVLQKLTARLPALELSALSTVLACASAGSGTTELEQRLALHFGTLITATGAAEIVLLDDPPAGAGPTALGLRDLLDLGAQVAAAARLGTAGRRADAAAGHRARGRRARPGRPEGPRRRRGRGAQDRRDRARGAHRDLGHRRHGRRAAGRGGCRRPGRRTRCGAAVRAGDPGGARRPPQPRRADGVRHRVRDDHPRGRGGRGPPPRADPHSDGAGLPRRRPVQPAGTCGRRGGLPRIAHRQHR